MEGNGRDVERRLHQFLRTPLRHARFSDPSLSVKLNLLFLSYKLQQNWHSSIPGAFS